MAYPEEELTLEQLKHLIVCYEHDILRRVKEETFEAYTRSPEPRMISELTWTHMHYKSIMDDFKQLEFIYEELKRKSMS